MTSTSGSNAVKLYCRLGIYQRQSKRSSARCAVVKRILWGAKLPDACSVLRGVRRANGFVRRIAARQQAGCARPFGSPAPRARAKKCWAGWVMQFVFLFGAMRDREWLLRVAMPLGVRIAGEPIGPHHVEFI